MQFHVSNFSSQLTLNRIETQKHITHSHYYLSRPCTLFMAVGCDLNVWISLSVIIFFKAFSSIQLSYDASTLNKIRCMKMLNWLEINKQSTHLLRFPNNFSWNQVHTVFLSLYGVAHLTVSCTNHAMRISKSNPQQFSTVGCEWLATVLWVSSYTLFNVPVIYFPSFYLSGT